MSELPAQASPHGALIKDISIADGLTIMSPWWLMMTRWPARLYSTRNLGALATASCTSYLTVPSCLWILSATWYGIHRLHHTCSALCTAETYIKHAAASEQMQTVQVCNEWNYRGGTCARRVLSQFYLVIDDVPGVRDKLLVLSGKGMIANLRWV